MSVTASVKSIDLCEGSAIVLHALSWQELETMPAELGEDRPTCMAYFHGPIEIMSPLSRHEHSHRIASDIVKALLDAQGRDWEDFGATTAGKPDTCFYGNSLAAVRACQGRIDIESDGISKTVVSAYEAIAVPEIWGMGDRPFPIFRLDGENHIESKESQMAISELLPQLSQQALEIGTSAMLREFRKTLSEKLS